MYGDLKERTLVFAQRILEGLTQFPNDARGWILSKQLGGCGTSIGANVWEADRAQTDADFVYKISIARKEASESEFWLILADRTKLLPQEYCGPMLQETAELASILGTIAIRTRNRETK